MICVVCCGLHNNRDSNVVCKRSKRRSGKEKRGEKERGCQRLFEEASGELNEDE